MFCYTGSGETGPFSFDCKKQGGAGNPATKECQMESNERNVNSVSTVCQGQPRLRRPINAALFHGCQVKVLLRRARAESCSRQKSQCLDRLLDGLQPICSALERLGR